MVSGGVTISPTGIVGILCLAENLAAKAQASDVTAAILIWLPVGARPKSGDFRRSPSAEVLSSFAEAVERAVNDGHPHSGRLPWIKVGSRIFNPDEVQSARSTVTDIKGRNPYTA